MTSPLSERDVRELEQLRKEDKAFARWMRKFTNEQTQHNYIRWFVRLCNELSMKPQQIVDQYKEAGETHDNLVDHIERSLNDLKQRAPASSLNWYQALISFLKHNGVILGASAFEIPKPKLEEKQAQYMPNEEEFEQLLRFAQKPRDKFLFAFFRYAGPRIGSLEDPVPLTLRHVLDLDLEALARGEIKFNHQSSCALLIYANFRSNELIQERSGLRTNYHEVPQIIRNPETYVTFLVPRAMQLLKEYLEDRLRKGEKLTPESYLFTMDLPRKKSYLDKSAASTMLMRVCKAAGFVVANDDNNESAKFTAHGLRRLFYNSFTGLDDADKEALMGHVKGIRASYHGTVDDLARVVEFMRPKYEKGMSVLMGMTDEQIRMKALLDMAHTLGIPDDKIVKIQETLGHAATIEDLKKVLSKEFDHLAFHATDGGIRYSSKVVTEVDLLEYVDAGWEIVKELSNGRIVIRTVLNPRV